MSALVDRLIPRLRETLPHATFEVCAGPPEYLRFAATHADVGDVQIYDDEDELTVVFGNFTHCHYGSWVAGSDDWIDDAVESAISDLRALFDDRLMMWGSHKTGGGIFREGEEDQTLWEPALFVWSGPQRRAA